MFRERDENLWGDRSELAITPARKQFETGDSARRKLHDRLEVDADARAGDRPVQRLFQLRARDGGVFVADVENADVAAAPRLRSIERYVRQTNEPVRLIGGSGKERKARCAADVNGELFDMERRSEDLANLASERDRHVSPLNAVTNDGELVAAHPGGVAATPHRGGEPVADLLQDRVSSLMPVNVVDRLEAVEVDETDREGLCPRLSRLGPIGQERQKKASIRQPGQIVRIRDRCRGLPPFLRGAMHVGDREAGTDELEERSGILDQHVADEAGSNDDERGQPCAVLVSGEDESGRDRRRSRGDDEDRAAREAHKTKRARGGDDPARDQQQRFFQWFDSPERRHR